MKKQAVLIAALLCCGMAQAQATNWLTDGGDNERSGWNKEEHILTKDNVKNLTLLWKTETKNGPRALHGLMAPLVVHDVPTASGKKELTIVLGSSDNLYAIDTANGAILWQKHFTYAPPPPRQGGGGPPQPAPADPTHNNFLQPGGSTDVPVIGPAMADGDRLIYVMDGGGVLHSLKTSTGEEVGLGVNMGAASKFSLQLYKNQVIFGAIYQSLNGIVSTNLDDPNRKVNTTVGFGRSGGLWGRRGPSIDSNSTVWTTTGDGQYDPSDPNNLVLANSMVGFQLKDGSWRVTDWFTPPNWDWLRKRDLDPNNTGTIFTFKGKEYIVASGKECRLYLLDVKNAGGPDHHTPVYKTPLFCNDSADFQNGGSWGALTSWQDASGTRWIVAPFWGPASKETKFPTTNTPATVEGGQAAFKLVDTNGKPELVPVWVSRDMYRGEPSTVANGMVFAYGAGENTQQAWTDIGLNFDSTIRASHSTHATIFVLDGQTGKELWTSGDQIKSLSHFSGITIANGKVYLGTYDGTLYCFGLPKS
jgi:hypothetical protein